MKKHCNFLLLCLFAITFFACTGEKNLNEFMFLIEKWEGQYNEMTRQEIEEMKWGVFSGKDILLSNTGIIFHEKLPLEIRKRQIYYNVTFPNCFNPVSFKLISLINNPWIFKNEERDFLLRIQYILCNSDFVYKAVDGNNSGKKFQEKFRYKKIN